MAFKLPDADQSLRHDLGLLGGGLIAFCVARALRLAWLSDDSFISFRYAWNLVHANGLVYNAGEYVEGYTNLLWTLAITGAMVLGMSPEVSSIAIGIACWLLLAGVLGLRSWQQRDQRPFIPLAAALVLLMDDYQTWATGGLETSMFTFLSVAGVLLASRPRADTRRMLIAGTLLAAAVCTRPDGVIFAAVGVAAVWFVNSDVSSRVKLARVSVIFLPLALVGIALVTFKLSYYGDMFPTAFYSKSTLDPYYGQGFFYVYLFFKKNWFLLPLVVILLIGSAGRLTSILSRTSLAHLAAFGLFVAYVAHSGGDFMFARRLIPAIVALGVSLPYPIYSSEIKKIRDIANEPSFYPKSAIATREVQAKVAAKALAGAPVRAVFDGGMCMFGYYSKLPYLVEATGLTQYSLAKKPLVERGIIGHEKGVDDQWLTDNSIQFIFKQEFPPIRISEPLEADDIYFENMLKAHIWIYVDAIMDPLRSDPTVKFVPIEYTLGRARREIEESSQEEAKSIYDFLDRFYFQTAGPEKRLLADELMAAVNARPR